MSPTTPSDVDRLHAEVARLKVEHDWQEALTMVVKGRLYSALWSLEETEADLRAEREACAKVADDEEKYLKSIHKTVARSIARKIRARGSL